MGEGGCSWAGQDWCIHAYMLSFRNANPGDLDVNRRVLEKQGFIRKSEGLRRSGIYT